MQLNKSYIVGFITLVFGCMFSKHSLGQNLFSSFDNGCENETYYYHPCDVIVGCSPVSWHASHGGPTHINSSIQEVRLEADQNGNSQGVFCVYTFLKGRDYKIGFRFKCPSRDGGLWIKATNGIYEDPMSDQPCREPVPTPLPLNPPETILPFYKPQVVNGWVTNYITYTPSRKLNNFWLYSQGDDIYIDWVEIEVLCEDDETFNNSDIIPSGLTEVDDFIRAGSAESGGNSALLVTNTINEETQLTAGNYILFSQDFSADPNTIDGSLFAGIAVCGQPASFKKENGPLSLKEPIKDKMAEKLTVLQNLSTGQPTLKLNLEMERDVGVVVINEIGQIMHSSPGVRMPPGENEITLPTLQLKSGLYIALVKVGDENLTRKFIVP